MLNEIRKQELIELCQDLVQETEAIQVKKKM